ncbi:MAG: 1-aminocyclopropane-1-carboxylate deaminase/D-cysteine desulfhydrase [Salibacteraceae bacterium]
MIDESTAQHQELIHPEIEKNGLQLWVKREDLLHPEISGNKWRKLKYNLKAARTGNYQRLLTFGGAFSNHLLAVAAAGNHFGFDTVGVVRGEAHATLNPTLQRCSDLGMQLHYIDRTTYRQKHLPAVYTALLDAFGPAYLIPEGGSNSLGVAGCREVWEGISVPIDVVACACGTGATFAGLVDAAPAGTRGWGFAVLKQGEHLKGPIGQWLGEDWSTTASWDLITDYHFGGYARYTPELLQFLAAFKSQQGFALDPVYTGKLFYGLFDQVRQGAFRRGTSILAVHTGGLQGIAGFQKRHQLTW